MEVAGELKGWQHLLLQSRPARHRSQTAEVDGLDDQLRPGLGLSHAARAGRFHFNSPGLAGFSRIREHLDLVRRLGRGYCRGVFDLLADGGNEKAVVRFSELTPRFGYGS